MLTKIEQQTMDAIISLSREYRKQNRFVEIELNMPDDTECSWNVRLGSIAKVSKSRRIVSLDGEYGDWEYDVMFVGEDSSFPITEETYNKLLEELK